MSEKPQIDPTRRAEIMQELAKQPGWQAQGNESADPLVTEGTFGPGAYNRLTGQDESDVDQVFIEAVAAATNGMTAAQELPLEDMPEVRTFLRIARERGYRMDDSVLQEAVYALGLRIAEEQAASEEAAEEANAGAAQSGEAAMDVIQG